MTTVLTRAELHALVWERPMTKLAAEFGLSSTALQTLCKKHEVPTPPCGHWMKKAHNKPVRVIPLPPRPSDGTGGDRILIHPGLGLAVSPAAAAAREAVRAGTDPATVSVPAPRDRLVDATLAKLAKAKPDAQGLVSVRGAGVIRVTARPVSVGRVGVVLDELARAAASRGVVLDAREGSARFEVEGETVTVELMEVADKVAHTATPAELQALAVWEAKQEADRKRYGHASGWGRPHIPKWEERHQGRLAVRLEEVRVRRDSPWGPAMRRTYADHGRRKLEAMAVTIVAEVVAMAVTKQENRDADERRRREAEEQARRRAEAERRAALEKRRSAALDELIVEHERVRQLERYVIALDAALAGTEIPPRVGRFVRWLHARLDRLKPEMAPAALETRFESRGLFAEDE
ncbi:hypothetical protein ACHMW5_36005 (plasmid) [Azospirillum melinis]|uniref:hypothetical protein n=1 Tax=Azospirillum melinis TaxID=328839 RepID=UPI0037573F43